MKFKMPVIMPIYGHALGPGPSRYFLESYKHKESISRPKNIGNDTNHCNNNGNLRF